MKQKILITSALPYVNNVPHLGNLIGCVLSADVFARYCRSKGYDTLYVCGTDEHGTATEVKALEEKLSPRALCDKYYKIHKEIYDWIGCSFDVFGRTSTQVHAETTQEIFKKLLAHGYISEGSLDQTYCENCKKFLADRFVLGACPKCNYPHARGDQCENCGKLLNPTELVNPKCKTCGANPIVKASKHLFLDLDKCAEKLGKWSAERAEEGFWTETAKSITQAWLKEGLTKRCITRDLNWGIKVPHKGFEDKVFYVWFDAPIGYISITKEQRPDWADWWKKDDAKLYQFMAKDNVPFHSILFPASLMGTGDHWNLVHHLESIEFLNYESGQFSKSRGIGVFGDAAMNSGIPADVWRFYLVYNRPESADSEFNWDDFHERVNNDLIANLGNLVNRTLTFAEKFYAGKVPNGKMNPALAEKVRAYAAETAKLMEAVKEREALKKVLELSKLGNQFFQEQEPWKKVKDTTAKAAADNAVYSLLHFVKDLGILISPFLPQTGAGIFRQLNLKEAGWADIGKVTLEPGHALGKPALLFEKLEKGRIAELREKYSARPKQAALPEIGFKVIPKAAALGIKARAALIEGVHVKNKHSELRRLAKEKSQEVVGRDLSTNAVNNGFKEIYRRLGIQGLAPASERLYEYIRKSGSIPGINTAVDSYNLIAIDTLLIIGAHDANKIKGNVRVDLVKGDEKYTPLGKQAPEKIAAGEYAFLDDEKVLCRLDVKQCEQTKVDEHTTNLFAYVQGNAATSDQEVEAALKRVCENIVKYCGGKYKLVK